MEYGIEFGKNRLGETVPTCHRAHTVKVTDDVNYKAAVRTADAEAAAEYISLGEKIEAVRRGIIEKAESGEIYDIFICFKATELGSAKKTDDYYLGRDIYYDLTKDGYRDYRGTKKQWKAVIKNSDPEWDAALRYSVNFKYTEE